MSGTPTLTLIYACCAYLSNRSYAASNVRSQMQVMRTVRSSQVGVTSSSWLERSLSQILEKITKPYVNAYCE